MAELSRERAEMLVRRIAEGRDVEAFTELYEFYAPRVRSFLQRRGADDSLAEEVCQEAMISAWRRAGTYRASRASVSTWLFTIARNRWIDRMRKEDRMEPQPLDPAFVPDPEGADERLDRQRRADQLLRALEDLPEEQSMALRRAYYGQQSAGEIAACTGVPLGTVKSRIRMAVERLRRNLESK